jgi:hypothetical protein
LLVSLGSRDFGHYPKLCRSTGLVR